VADGGPGPQAGSNRSERRTWPSRTGPLAWERPQARVGWACTSQPQPWRVRHAEHRGRSRQRAQAPARHRPPLWTRGNRNNTSNLRIRRRVTAERVSRAQRPRCHCDTPDRQRLPSMGGQVPPPAKQLERHTEWPSIVPDGHMDRSNSFISAIRWRQVWKPPIASTAASSMPRVAFSICVISCRAATAAPGAWDGTRGRVPALVHFPRIVRARSARPWNQSPLHSGGDAIRACRGAHVFADVEKPFQNVKLSLRSGFPSTTHLRRRRYRG